MNPINISALIVGVSEYQFPDTYSPIEFTDDDGHFFFTITLSTATMVVLNQRI
jgi:hypothetical protein